MSQAFSIDKVRNQDDDIISPHQQIPSRFFFLFFF